MSGEYQIRQARQNETDLLTDITLRSKAHWGYDAQFMADARVDLTFRPAEFVPDFHVYILEIAGRPVGFVSLKPVDARTAEMDHLFIAPEGIGKGFGRRLWEHAVEVARRAGYSEITLASDPFAEPFYLKMGAVRVGEKESFIRAGRFLPVMKFTITKTNR